MKNIKMVTTNETIIKNDNDFYDTVHIEYSVLFTDDTITEYISDAPGFVYDFIDSCMFYHETYFENTGKGESRETIYFNQEKQCEND